MAIIHYVSIGIQLNWHGYIVLWFFGSILDPIYKNKKQENCPMRSTKITLKNTVCRSHVQRRLRAANPLVVKSVVKTSLFTVSMTMENAARYWIFPHVERRCHSGLWEEGLLVCALPLVKKGADGKTKKCLAAYKRLPAWNPTRLKKRYGLFGCWPGDQSQKDW